MPYLHYFYPENDCALAADNIGYTAGRGAMALHRSGMILPLWTGEAGDRYIDCGTPAYWVETMRDTFGRQVFSFDGNPAGLIPRPWGWSKPVVRTYLENGISAGLLPDTQALEVMRQLSHRRTAIALEARLYSLYDIDRPRSVLADSVDVAMETVRRFGRAMVKQPWSSSGRGVTDTATLSPEELGKRIAGTIRKQGSVVVQPFVENAVDYGLLFDHRDGQSRYLGLSVFERDKHYTYTGSLVAADDVLMATLAGKSVIVPPILPETVSKILSDLVGTAYTGIIGVDILGIPGGDTFAVGEINLRHTMGYVAHRLACTVLAPGLTARMTIRPNTDAAPGFSAEGRRLTGGTLRLTPPDTPIAFSLEVL